MESLMTTNEQNAIAISKNADSFMTMANAFSVNANNTERISKAFLEIQAEKDQLLKEKMHFFENGYYKKEEIIREYRANATLAIEDRQEMNRREALNIEKVKNLEQFLKKQAFLLEQADKDVKMLKQLVKEKEMEKIVIKENLLDDLRKADVALYVSSIQLVALRVTLAKLDNFNRKQLQNVLVKEIQRNSETEAAASKIIEVINNPTLIEEFINLPNDRKMEEVLEIQSALSEIERIISEENQLLAITLEDMIQQNHKELRSKTWDKCSGDMCLPLDLWVK